VKKLSIRIKKEIMKDIAIKFFFKMKKNKKNKLHMIKITSRNHRKGCSDVFLWFRLVIFIMCNLFFLFFFILKKNLIAISFIISFFIRIDSFFTFNALELLMQYCVKSFYI
jgi:hypothetical protein